MKLIYTFHALIRLVERYISKKEVERALRLGRIEELGDNLRKFSLRNQDGTLVVIIKIRPSAVRLVVTAYWE